MNSSSDAERLHYCPQYSIVNNISVFITIYSILWLYCCVQQHNGTNVWPWTNCEGPSASAPRHRLSRFLSPCRQRMKMFFLFPLGLTLIVVIKNPGTRETMKLCAFCSHLPTIPPFQLISPPRLRESVTTISCWAGQCRILFIQPELCELRTL